MDVRKWCNSGSTSIQLGRCNDDVSSSRCGGYGGLSSSKLKWKMVWMKLKKEKKKLFDSTHVVMPPPLSYDAYNYSQNFDHGTTFDEPDTLSRSFSARFADPSVLLFKKPVL